MLLRLHRAAATALLLLAANPGASARVWAAPAGAADTASASPVAAPSGGSTTAPADAAPPWSPPDPDSLPDTPFGRTVRYGRDLITRTVTLIGPDAKDPAMRYTGNGLTCQSCHLQAGTQQFGLPLAGIWGLFPQYVGRENEVRTLEERINGCMERSMNGHALPLGGPEMKAMLTYIRYVSAPETVGQALVGRGVPALPLPDRAADPIRGRKIYGEMCAACHGADGQGQRLDAADAAQQGKRYQFPPLWGPESYNDGAGMARTITAARFAHANMPFGTTWQSPALSDSDAFDVMAFVNDQPRPHKGLLENDFPDRSKKPVDAAYPPFVGPFTPEQHRYGPWQPIVDWMKAHQGTAPLSD